jgi:hypothetical protein
LKKDIISKIIIIPIGKAAIMDTVWRFDMELSEKISPIGNRIKSIDQYSLIRFEGSLFSRSLYEYEAATRVMESKVVA